MIVKFYIWYYCGNGKQILYYVLSYLFFRRKQVLFHLIREPRITPHGYSPNYNSIFLAPYLSSIYLPVAFSAYQHFSYLPPAHNEGQKAITEIWLNILVLWFITGTLAVSLKGGGSFSGRTWNMGKVRLYACRLLNKFFVDLTMGQVRLNYISEVLSAEFFRKDGKILRSVFIESPHRSGDKWWTNSKV